MTREEWQRVEKALSGIYGKAELMVDGNNISFVRELVSNNKLGIVAYVNGRWEAKWFSARTEYPEQRFLRREERFLHKPKLRAEIKKHVKRYGRRFLKEINLDPDQKYVRFSPIWPNVTAIRRYYEKNFASIELIEVIG